MAPSFPLVRPLRCSDPLELLPALTALTRPFLLHSTLRDARGRWSFFGAEPFASYRGRDYEGAIAGWRALAARVRREGEASTLVPFTGGAVGYWAYDFGRRLERVPTQAVDDLRLPDFVLGFYDVVGAFDHDSRQAWLFSSGLPEDGAPARAARAVERVERMTRLLEPRTPPASIARRGGRLSATSTFDRSGYERTVARVQEHIACGDLFQANLSQRWTLPLAGPEGVLGTTPLDAPGVARAAGALHAALADRSPAPFAALIVAGDHAVVSASPERFLELRGGRVETRPIKGTRPRGGNLADDARHRAELIASDKDRAENVMIVDVMRNDLGRVCETGSVRATALCELETFPQVYHLTSTVEGRLAAGHDAVDLLHACFPGGSITGAPKIRAMQILDALEPVRRHVYTGSVGYMDWRGDADWNIAIRTALLTTRDLHVAAGGGITADSDPAAEYEETLHKVEGMRQALAQAFDLALDDVRVPA